MDLLNFKRNQYLMCKLGFEALYTSFLMQYSNLIEELAEPAVPVGKNQKNGKMGP